MRINWPWVGAAIALAVLCLAAVVPPFWLAELGR